MCVNGRQKTGGINPNKKPTIRFDRKRVDFLMICSALLSLSSSLLLLSSSLGFCDFPEDWGEIQAYCISVLLSFNFSFLFLFVCYAVILLDCFSPLSPDAHIHT